MLYEYLPRTHKHTHFVQQRKKKIIQIKAEKLQFLSCKFHMYINIATPIFLYEVEY